MTDFTPDFAGAAPGYAEVARPLFLGLDPLLAALLACLILIAGIVGWYARDFWPRADDEREVAKAIHARILAAARAARSAESDRLIEKARALKSTVEDLLGEVLELAKLAGPIGDVTKALEGKAAAKPAAPAPAATTPAPTSAPTQNQSVNVTVVTAPAPSPAAPPSPGMTAKEQLDELDRAVRAFHDHWSVGEKRIGELIAARRQLSRMPPKADDHGPSAGHAGHAAHHGDDHGAHGAKPVWERKSK